MRPAQFGTSFVTLLFFAAVSVPHVLADENDPWSDNATEASEQAKKDNKDMLLLFTGSDWCPPCIKLEKDILSKEEFIKKVQEKFALVKFDFPQNIEQPDELIKQNEQWSNRFGIEGFPTIVLVDSNEKPYAFTGLREEPPQAYLAHLTELQQIREKRDAAFAKAKDKTGIERARLLDEALAALDPDIVEVYYEDVVNEIGVLDTEDVAGLRTKYFAARDREMRKAVMSNINMVARLKKPAEAIEFIDMALKQIKLPIDMWLLAQKTKLRLLRKLEKVDEANALLDSMIDADGIGSETRQRLIINKAYYLVSRSETEKALAELGEQIASSPENLLLNIAKGELYDSMGEFEKAIEAYDQSIMAAAARPEILVEVVGAKADTLFDLKKVDEAIATLDTLANDENIPTDLRAEAILHKALILREIGRRRAAILAENKAIEIVETPEEKGEIQKLVEQFRRKFDKPSGEE